jgi:hypothetical protein
LFFNKSIKITSLNFKFIVTILRLRELFCPTRNLTNCIFRYASVANFESEAESPSRINNFNFDRNVNKNGWECKIGKAPCR